MTKINERFILILNTFFRKNVSEMARKIGIPQTTLNNIVANRLNSPSAENIERLLLSMPNINSEWLLKGEGEMLKNDDKEQSGIINSPYSFQLNGNGNKRINQVIANSETLMSFDK